MLSRFERMLEGVGYELHCEQCGFQDFVNGVLMTTATLPTGHRLILRADGPSTIDTLIECETCGPEITSRLRELRSVWRKTWKSPCICVSCGETGYYGWEPWRNCGFLDRSIQFEGGQEHDIINGLPIEFLSPDAVRPSPYLRCLYCRRFTLLSLSGPIGWVLYFPASLVSFVCAMTKRGHGFRVRIPCSRCRHRYRRLMPQAYIA